MLSIKSQSFEMCPHYNAEMLSQKLSLEVALHSLQLERNLLNCISDYGEINAYHLSTHTEIPSSKSLFH